MYISPGTLSSAMHNLWKLLSYFICWFLLKKEITSKHRSSFLRKTRQQQQQQQQQQHASFRQSMQLSQTCLLRLHELIDNLPLTIHIQKWYLSGLVFMRKFCATFFLRQNFYWNITWEDIQYFMCVENIVQTSRNACQHFNALPRDTDQCLWKEKTQGWTTSSQDKDNWKMTGEKRVRPCHS